MTQRFLFATIVLISLLCSSTVLAQRGKRLAVGDPAPGLAIAEWIQGDETGIDMGTTYVVEFWATWCKPCVKSIPHLTELQNQYEKDQLRIIGISDEEPDTVRKFVRKMGRKMGYTVAVDKRGGSKRAWMKSAGVNGIPVGFIVGPDGTIQFIGHPNSSDFEDVLHRVIQNRYNKKLLDQAQEHLDNIAKYRKQKNWRQYERMSDEVIQREPRIFYQLILDRFDVFMLEQNDPVKANAYAREVIEAHPDDPELLSWLSLRIITNPKIPDAQRDLDIALEAAQAARTNGRPNDPQFLMTEAIVRFHRGEIDDAVSLQERAYFMASPRKKTAYKPKLEEFRKKQADMKATAPEDEE